MCNWTYRSLDCIVHNHLMGRLLFKGGGECQLSFVLDHWRVPVDDEKTLATTIILSYTSEQIPRWSIML